MKKYQYKCTLLSDVIITSFAATEGYKESLDYISGAKFLGIIAGKLYNDNNTAKTLDLFHNGSVRYSDATPLVDNEPMLRVPFAWFHQKGEGLADEIYLHHKLQANNGKQLKQARSGYFSKNKEKFLSIEQGFSIKSKYDSNKRKSEDGFMFGYFCLKKGSTWTFFVEDEKGIYADEIKQVFEEKKHRVGRSRSSEYGLVEIKFMQEVFPLFETKTTYANETIIYAQSNLCFYDEAGKTTAIPTTKQLVGTDKAKIDWAKSQVRSRNYQTWNRYRKNKDTDRIIIEKGSVFVVVLDEPVNATHFENGIGSHRAEGFGAVLINPAFLLSESEKLDFKLAKSETEYIKIYDIEKGDTDEKIVKLLEKRLGFNDFDSRIDKKANDFIRNFRSDFEGISKSQWGTLRSYAEELNEKAKFIEKVFDNESGLLYRGQTENEWRTNGRREKLANYLNNNDNLTDSEYLPFVVKLSNLMAKNNK